MRFFAKVLLLGLPVLSLGLLHTDDAAACGGCFVSQTENTQVRGHRMVLSISPERTTLWDQIEYEGNPTSFAWVLPIKGTVDVGLSSDAMFANLEALTQVQVLSPQITCPPPPSCGDDGDGVADANGSGAASSSGGQEPPVEVLSQEVVGPYETVQLASDDPAALKTWLTSHGYSLPDDIAPIVDAYVQDGFNFLALKLVPGQGVDAMRPVRITTQGAVPVLPLRMVAAGTGAVTPLLLWVLGEGRYEPGNFPSFVVPADQLVWNWDTQSSNYTEIRAAQFTESQGRAWQVEAGEQMPTYQIEQSLLSLAQYDPVASGYGDGTPETAMAEAQEDLDVLLDTISRESAWITRLYGELSREALGEDLEVGAASDQSPVVRFFQTEKSVGTPPACPTFDPCGVGSDDGWVDGFDNRGGCNVVEERTAPSGLAALGALLGAAVLGVRRRRAQRGARIDGSAR